MDIRRALPRPELRGVVRPRSGKPVTIDVIDICRFADGRLVEHWGVPDRFALLHQLGALPPPPNRT
jgi:predicted ester cyclase